MWPDKPLDYVKLDNDEEGYHYGLFLGDRLVSVVSLFIEGDEGQFRKFATDLDEQGKGYGSELLHFLFNKTEEENVKRIWCNARKDKAGFYEKFGMQTTDNEFTKGGIDYVIMEKIMN